MWIVRHAYYDKALRYARMHGKTNLDAGGISYDVPYLMAQYGIVPDSIYSGLNYGTKNHVHGEVNAVIQAYMNAIISAPNKTLSTAWKEGLNGILDAYFGKMPETFTVDGKSYTPKSWMEACQIDPQEYVQLTSFTHHPFYEKFVLEIPDNWTASQAYNVPLEVLQQVIDNSLEAGYAVNWAADVSEKGFVFNKCFAIIPVTDVEEISGNGVTAKVDGVSVAAGNEKLMEKLGIEFLACSHVGTVVHMAVDGKYAGHILISDTVKPHAKQAIKELKKCGVKKTIMLTGDRKNVADYVAKDLGIQEVYSELLPGDKVSKVEALLANKTEKEKLDQAAAKKKSKLASYQKQLASDKELLAWFEAEEKRQEEMDLASAKDGNADNTTSKAQSEKNMTGSTASKNTTSKATTESKKENTTTSSPSTTVSSGNLIWPVPSCHSISSGYDYRIHPVTGVRKLHAGIDIPCSTGTTIVAAASGTVVDAGYNAYNGNYLKISHGNGLETMYLHCSKLLASSGARVSGGQTIAQSGATGMVSGAHLHFVVKKNGNYVNPQNYL